MEKKFKIFTIFFTLIILLVLITGCTLSDSAGNTSKSDTTTAEIGINPFPEIETNPLFGSIGRYRNLVIQEINQEKSKWCWAAAAEIIIKYLDPSSAITQGEIVRQVYGDERNEGASAGTALANNDVSYTFRWGEISYMDIKNNIDNNQPIEVDIGYKCENCGNHCLIISGYYEIEYPEYMARQYVRIWNPLEDKQYEWYKYNELIDNNEFFWRITRYNVNLED